MDFKKFFDTFKDKVCDIFNKMKENKKYFVGVSMSFVAFLMLLVVIFFSSNYNVKKDADMKMMHLVSKETDGALKMHTLVERVAYKNDMSLLKVKLVTGRTHQIRIHLSSKNHPIIGDSKYGDFEFNKFVKKEYHLDHQFLHAYSLTFTKPIGCIKYLEGKTFSSPLPKKLSQIKMSIFND